MDKDMCLLRLKRLRERNERASLDEVWPKVLRRLLAVAQGVHGQARLLLVPLCRMIIEAFICGQVAHQKDVIPEKEP